VTLGRWVADDGTEVGHPTLRSTFRLWAEPARLDLLSGKNPQAGHVNLDMQALPGIDAVYRIDPFYPRLPFDSGVFEAVRADNAVEHIADINGLVQELWRVSRDGASWWILTPGWRDANSWNDPTHLSHWGEQILQFYTEEGFDGRRYPPALLTYTRSGSIDGGLEFRATVRKPEGP
jgi:hypothetical protein